MDGSNERFPNVSTPPIITPLFNSTLGLLIVALSPCILLIHRYMISLILAWSLVIKLVYFVLFVVGDACCENIVYVLLGCRFEILLYYVHCI